MTRRSWLTGAAAAGGASLLGACASAPGDIRIGFLVKQPQEQWFQDEWRFARAAARRHGFSLIAIGAEDGDRVLSALNTLYARFAQGFIICAPDPRLGPAIAGFAADTGLKAMSVDDRLTGADGLPIAGIPHVGISARKIGALAGAAAAAEAKRRGWPIGETGILRISFDSLETGRERLLGAVEALQAAGYPASAIFSAPQRTTDTEGAFSAASPVLTARAGIDRWIILGLNDETVVGGVRAAEGLSMAAANIIGVGIGGSEVAIADLAKPRPTGFYASVLLSPRRHGYDTALAMYEWVGDGRRPPPLTLTSGTVITRDTYRDLLAREAAA
ncbi:substrate-binding domain-containing protein [Polymorphobacter fuscus]|uniref:L-arabinose-binding periplasmic protein n=1 Tax=Sandarakinorhabdus fusca TaxID=1439888 RepID=A0A7C9GQA4_9SPHN|nr:substrate-binding domain-containing protein [Polymorphobacter fuscus]KAB7644873.1 substrate-binding domain-containing protein [Polymorphobacter fuscus]MQT18155.1 substrate-binding domain-containing protein [Polymorphobacter fuscus]NJC09473.1 ABC-type sugar transport system substrate-binding protein [Polymorphobacter fuscus]